MALLSNEERESQVLLSRELGPIFPLYGVIELAPGRLVCECGKLDCRNAGKHPRWRNFQKRASVDPNRIRDWFDEFPHANYGVLTGIAAIAIDVDVRPDSNGLLTLDYLQIDHGRRIPYTVEVLTGRGNGSRHLYFSPDATVRTRAKVLPGLDVRAAGGYCVAAGSRHFYGGYYHFAEEQAPDEQTIAALPGFLLAALAETAAKSVLAASETLSSALPAALDIPVPPIAAPLPDRVVLGAMLHDPVARFYWDGGRRNPTPSEDDFALAAKLAFYCRHNLPQMYRLFMRSGLWRPKFVECRPVGTYALWTLRRAIDHTPQTWIRKERRIPGAKRGRRPSPESKAILELHRSQPALPNVAIALQLGLTVKRVRNAISYHKRARAENAALLHNLAITREPVEYYPTQKKIDSILVETDSIQDERKVG